MGTARLLLVLICSLSATTAPAEPITIVDHSPGKECVSSEALVVLSCPDREYRIPAVESGAVDVAADCAAALESEGCWSSNERPSIGGRGRTIHVFPASRIRGSFARDEKPQSLGGELTLKELDGESIPFPIKPVECAVEASAWNCSVPSLVRFDLKLKAEGFAPLYLWDVGPLGREGATMPVAELRSGASLAGWLEDSEGSPVESARVTVTTRGSRDETRRVTEGRSNARGFFQLTGLPAGDFTLRAESDGRSRVQAPFSVDDGEELVWPRALVHENLASLSVRLEPPVQEDGRRWRVTLAAAEERYGDAQPRRGAASTEGELRAQGLDTGLYRLTIDDGEGSVVRELMVELNEGVEEELLLDVSRVQVLGRVMMGALPVSTSLRFSNRDGRTVQAASDENGWFRAFFPTRGTWTPRVVGDGLKETRLKSIQVPEGDTPSILIELPHGRIHGRVVTEDGESVVAAVHLLQTGQLKAQQVTEGDGRFEFFAIPEGSYVLQAESEKGTTPRPVPVEAREGEDVEVRLEIQSHTTLLGTVTTARGAAASGAIVRVSIDGGMQWFDLTADVRGQFALPLPAGVRSVALIILTYAHPTMITTVSLTGQSGSEEISLGLHADGGLVGVMNEGGRQGVYVSHGGTTTWFNALMFPAGASGLHGGRAYLSPGQYTFCPQSRLDERCKRVYVAPGSETTVDLRSDRHD
jgi:hypothetical protein